MSITIFSSAGGHLILPDARLLLVSRENGGNLIVNPPRTVWERSELTREELMLWSFLVAAAGRAMLDSLPQLTEGCLNYWEAGNWALNLDAGPKGFKKPRDYRKMHLHLLGRNPNSTDPHWKWGESPEFPAFSEKDTRAIHYQRLNPEECLQIVTLTAQLLETRYHMNPSQIQRSSICRQCKYPFAGDTESCNECNET